MEGKRMRTALKGKKMLVLGTAAAALIGFGITWAYYSSKQALANPLTTAHSGAAIVEEYNPDSSFLPGELVTKRVALQNTGKMDIFLRVEVMPEEGWYQEDGSEIPELKTLKVEKGWTDAWGEPDIPENASQPILPETAYGGTEGKEWTKAYKDANGKYYRYYKRILAAGEMTADILESIRLSPDVSNDRHAADYSDKHYRLTFHAEAVPVEDHGGQPGVQASWNMSVSLSNDGSLTWTQGTSRSGSQAD